MKERNNLLLGENKKLLKKNKIKNLKKIRNLKKRIKNLKKIRTLKKKIKKNQIFFKKKFKKKKILTKKKIKTQKAIIMKRGVRLNENKKTLKQKRNLIPFSYFSRFILRKKKEGRYFKNFWIQKKEMKKVRNKKKKELKNIINNHEESQLFESLREKIKKIENKQKMKGKKIPIMAKPLSKREFLIGKLNLKYLRMNLFANLSWRNTSALATCGEHYKGPKKKTMHAREKVIQKIIILLNEKQITTLDIKIVPFGKKAYKQLIRMLIRSTKLYFRYLLTPRKRTHGFNRPKKIRRT